MVRGNISEIKTLAVGSGTTRGVDADGVHVGQSDQSAADARKLLGPDERAARELRALTEETVKNHKEVW